MNTIPKYFETVTEAVNDLISRGFTHDFIINDGLDCIICQKKELTLSPDDFHIDEIYRFEGQTDPGDEMIVYAISSKKFDIKGTIINSFGVYADCKIDKLIEKISIQNKEKPNPIKRHQAIISFSKDHHFGLLLVWKIRQGIKKGVSTDRISKYVLFFFKEDLVKHFKEEEQLLFIKLPSNDILRKQAEAEHQTIYKLIDDIGKNMSDTFLLNQLADALEKHIRFEERELFNHLQKNINAEDLEIVAKRLSNNSNEIDEKWEDVFWEIKK